MKKVSDLTGAALDYAVATLEGRAYGLPGTIHAFSPSTKWSQGGPIIERESMTLTPFDDKWEARCKSDIPLAVKFIERRGPTPLIAAMRCYVASKLGDTINLEEPQ